MNEDQVKGVGEKVKGKINEGVGRMTDDSVQEAKGDAQQVDRYLKRSD
ncbi:CsbD family protein [Caballeronia sp. LZ035]|nr:CsbD family protein [Caballeronia sp. LZ035]MDR5763121.1 CsbD family protein [Caballeronia sp. LZ035]